MHRLLFIFLTISFISEGLFAADKLSVDIAVEKFSYSRPNKGVGKAGTLIFNSVALVRNGISLNVNNADKIFDAEIFVRPTFLGFITKLGNFGYTIDEKSFVNTMTKSELESAKMILDDYQLNLSGQYFNFAKKEMNINLKKFLLYCQNGAQPVQLADNDTDSIVKSCLSFLTLNGNYQPNNDYADFDFESVDAKGRLFVEGKISSFDIRKRQINAVLKNLRMVPNENMELVASDIDFNCDKEPELQSLDAPKIKEVCLNRFKLKPTKMTMTDHKSKSHFSFDVTDVTVQNQLIYATLGEIRIADEKSTTTLSNFMLNCKKGIESDLLKVPDVLNDCVEYSRVSIGQVDSNKVSLDDDEDDKKGNPPKNTILNINNGNFVAQTEIKLLGKLRSVTLAGTVAYHTEDNKIIITVNETRLPFGFTSVKLLMKILKKSMDSKKISISNNVITVDIG